MTEFWSVPIPKDHSGNRVSYAKAAGVEFTSFPYQPYYGRLGRHSALIGSLTSKIEGVFGTIWSATVYLSRPNGSSEPLEQKHFPADQMPEAFEWAAGLINAKNADAPGAPKGVAV
jgi:hypothetical protein